MKRNENHPAALDKQNPVGSGSQKLSQLLDAIEERGRTSFNSDELRDNYAKLVKALRRAIDRFTFIQEQEIVGASNAAQWAKDDILFILGDRADVGEEKADLEEKEA